MFRIGIIGGKLQGMEAVYLAKHAGYRSFVIDRNRKAPALYISDESEVLDVVAEPEKAKELFSKCDAIIPACENNETLEFLDKVLSEMGIPFLFDLESYRITSSKEKTNEFMDKVGAPVPAPWPDCGFPIIVKPSCQSGSIGVSAVNNEEERQRALKKVAALGDVPIQQEFVSGKSVSIEVIGNGKSARSYVTTEVILDRNYDCKQVLCENRVLPEEDRALFEEIGRKLGVEIGLKALMDVEAIYTKRGLRLLELDARIPSQTPACICAATGINLLEELVCSKLGKESGKTAKNGCAIYEHYIIRGEILYTCGEKEFSHVDEPCFIEDFFEADEAITDYRSGRSEWRCMVIFKGDNFQDALWKKKQFIRTVMERCELDEYVDLSPEMI